MIKLFLYLATATLWIFAAGPLRAEMFTAPGRSLLRAAPSALIQLSQPRNNARSGNHASLFTTLDGQSLIAALPLRPMLFGPNTANATAALPASTGSPLQRLRHLIQYAESRRDGYDAVQHGARIKPTKPPTQMTIAEIFRWIDETPGQPHAIGRYQFIPATLHSLVERLGLHDDQHFSPYVQDRLADILLVDAGLHAVATGAMLRASFMKNLAKIWAGLPTDTGQSFYHGYAGNKAALTWVQFDAEMRKIFPG